jgi:hypothetical protein
VLNLGGVEALLLIGKPELEKQGSEVIAFWIKDKLVMLVESEDCTRRLLR